MRQLLEMIERVVLLRLDAAFRDQLPDVVAATREVLTPIPGVRALRVGVAADDRTTRDWDVCIEVRLDDLAAVEAYRAHERHRNYLDVFLRPMLERIRVWNFEVGHEPTAKGNKLPAPSPVFPNQ